METDILERLVTLLDAATRDEADDAPALLIRIVENETTPDGFELGMLDIHDHPTDVLLGLVAEDDWQAIGVISNGTAYATDGPIDRGRGTRVRTTMLMMRDGSAAGTCTFADGRVIDQAPSEGFIPDCMRRVFGLPTAPPDRSNRELFAVMWLNYLVSRRIATWREAARLHPAVQVLAGVDVVAAARAMNNVCDWRMVRELITERGWWHELIPAEHVDWMDDGLMARWLFGAFPSLPALYDELSPTIKPRVGQTLRALGIDVTSVAA